MNDTFAECRYTLTRELFYESMLRVQRDSMGKLWTWAAAILSALWLGMSVFTLATGGSIRFALVELCVLIAVFFCFTVWMPRRKAKRGWEAMVAKGIDDAERTVSFYDEWLEVRFGEEEIDMDYTDIIKVLETKSLMILLSIDHRGIILKKDSISGCSTEELLHHIKNNGGLLT